MPARTSRWTKQLKVIVDLVYSSDSPLTADEVYARARERLPRISLGTVYRNLNKLVAEGLLSETLKGGTAAFARHPFSNATFECERCGRLLCVPFELRQSDLERQSGMRVKRWTLRLTGVCRECEDQRT
jgi:Fe2+ or Zn2+ uptake regulation protein